VGLAGVVGVVRWDGIGWVGLGWMMISYPIMLPTQKEMRRTAFIVVWVGGVSDLFLTDGRGMT